MIPIDIQHNLWSVVLILIEPAGAHDGDEPFLLSNEKFDLEEFQMVTDSLMVEFPQEIFHMKINDLGDLGRINLRSPLVLLTLMIILLELERNSNLDDLLC